MTRKKKPGGQKAWQERKRAQGLCTICGKRPLAKGSIALCPPCLERRRKQMRRSGGWKPRKKGGPGRPPVGKK